MCLTLLDGIFESQPLVQRPGLAVIALLVPEVCLRGVGVMLEDRVDVLGLIVTEWRKIGDIDYGPVLNPPDQGRRLDRSGRS